MTKENHQPNGKLANVLAWTTSGPSVPSAQKGTPASFESKTWKHHYNEELHKAEDLAEEIETRDALRAPDREKFIEAIRKEVSSLINDTKTLIPVKATD